MFLPPRSTRLAFSLVELSIVLVILGLLTGGILAGQSLIRAAELRATTTQFASYRAAVYSFRDKYFALPGDMTNATAFWGSAGGTGSDSACFTAQTSGSTATCNGDGDGQIFGYGAVGHAERFSAWKHLANAGLVEGAYTGVSSGGPATYVAVPGTTNPIAKTPNAFFDLGYAATSPSQFFSGSRSNVNTIGVYGTVSGTGALKPEEAWNIDTKFDDGSPVYGSYYATIKSSAYGGNCASSDANTATYDFTITAKNCILLAAF